MIKRIIVVTGSLVVLSSYLFFSAHVGYEPFITYFAGVAMCTYGLASRRSRKDTVTYLSVAVGCIALMFLSFLVVGIFGLLVAFVSLLLTASLSLTIEYFPIRNGPTI